MCQIFLCTLKNLHYCHIRAKIWLKWQLNNLMEYSEQNWSRLYNSLRFIYFEKASLHLFAFVNFRSTGRFCHIFLWPSQTHMFCQRKMNFLKHYNKNDTKFKFKFDFDFIIFFCSIVWIGCKARNERFSGPPECIITKQLDLLWKIWFNIYTRFLKINLLHNIGFDSFFLSKSLISGLKTLFWVPDRVRYTDYLKPVHFDNFSDAKIH